MVRYFRVNDPYRLLILFLFVVAVRIAAILLGHPFTLLHDQYFATSVNAYDQSGPLFVWLTQLIHFGFNDHAIPSMILASLLITLQAFSLNSILINNKALTQNTYLPAACYVLVMSISPEFVFISPALCALTFILIGLNYMLFHLQYRGSEENILSTGFVLGLAILFHPPSAVFILAIYGIYLAYSSTLNRRYLLVAFGIFLPLISVWVYFFWQNAGTEFWNDLSGQVFSMVDEVMIPINQLVLLISLPLLIGLVSASQTFTGIGLTNHQIITQRTFLAFGFFAGISILTNVKVSANALVYLAPSLAFFGAQFLLTRERRWLSEAVFFMLVLWALAFMLLPITSPGILALDYSLLR